MLTCSMCNIDSDCVFNNPYKNNVDMKAPEKLYLSKNIYSTYMYQVPDPDDETAVEYTRADSFMKKAENFLEMLGYGFTIIDNITHANYDKEQLIADFRNYIKEE